MNLAETTISSAFFVKQMNNAVGRGKTADARAMWVMSKVVPVFDAIQSATGSQRPQPPAGMYGKLKSRL